MQDLVDILQRMGRWAQAKRRGGGPAVVAALDPPPAGILESAGGNLIFFGGGADDFGGLVQVERSLTGADPWESAGEFGWDSPVLIGTLVEIGAYWFRAREVGNGVVYEGTGPYSDPYDNT